MGRKASGDEQTVGFRGKSRHKQRIRNKRCGDGMQSDSLAEDGYTYDIMYRFDETPNVEQGAAPLHQRVLSMCESIKGKWRTLYFDNLYCSPNFARQLQSRQIYMTGTIRTNRSVKEEGHHCKSCCRERESTPNMGHALLRLHCTM